MKTYRYALSCNLLLLTTHIFCADPCSGAVDDLTADQNQESDRTIQVISPEEFKWLATCFDNAPTPSTPEHSDSLLGLTEEEYTVIAATARPPKQSNVISTGFAIPGAEFVPAPGVQRFYSLLELAQQKAVLISGKSRPHVDAAFRKLLEIRCSDPADDVQSLIERVQKEEGVLCAIKETQRLCDVLVPVELEPCVANVSACAHENSFVCSQHRYKVCAALKQAAQQAEATHEAMVSMPYTSEVITYAAE